MARCGGGSRSRRFAVLPCVADGLMNGWSAGWMDRLLEGRCPPARDICTSIVFRILFFFHSLLEDVSIVGALLTLWRLLVFWKPCRCLGSSWVAGNCMEVTFSPRSLPSFAIVHVSEERVEACVASRGLGEKGRGWKGRLEERVLCGREGWAG